MHYDDDLNALKKMPKSVNTEIIHLLYSLIYISSFKKGFIIGRYHT